MFHYDMTTSIFLTKIQKLLSQLILKVWKVIKISQVQFPLSFCCHSIVSRGQNSPFSTLNLLHKNSCLWGHLPMNLWAQIFKSFILLLLLNCTSESMLPVAKHPKSAFNNILFHCSITHTWFKRQLLDDKIFI